LDKDFPGFKGFLYRTLPPLGFSSALNSGEGEKRRRASFFHFQKKVQNWILEVKQGITSLRAYIVKNTARRRWNV